MPRRLVSLALALSAFGCATTRTRATAYVYATDSDPVNGRAVNVGQVDMPVGESFAGSYFSSQLGDLFLEQTGDQVTGTYAYDRTACHATGRIEGRATGTLLRFSWTESQATCGRPLPIAGRGFFLLWFDHGADGATIPRLNGEWGFGTNEMGNGQWSALRDRVRRQPPAANATP